MVWQITAAHFAHFFRLADYLFRPWYQSTFIRRRFHILRPSDPKKVPRAKKIFCGLVKFWWSFSSLGCLGLRRLSAFRLRASDSVQPLVLLRWIKKTLPYYCRVEKGLCFTPVLFRHSLTLSWYLCFAYFPSTALYESSCCLRCLQSDLSLISYTLKPNGINSVCESHFFFLHGTFASKPYSSGLSSGHLHSPRCYLPTTSANWWF